MCVQGLNVSDLNRHGDKCSLLYFVNFNYINLFYDVCYNISGLQSKCKNINLSPVQCSYDLITFS